MGDSKTAELGPPVVRWRRAKGPADGRPPLLVLLHGRGADEHDLFEFAPGIDERFAIAAVRGPLDNPDGGYTWAQSRSAGRAVPASLRATIHWFREWLDGLDGPRAEPQRVYLLGFSAGMALAAALVLDDPQRFAGAALLSGTLPFDTDVPLEPERLAGVPVFWAHGAFDVVIPAELVDRTQTYLRSHSGAALAAHRFPIGHEISAAELVAIGGWLSAQLVRTDDERGLR